jgi:hypothetical protein
VAASCEHGNEPSGSIEDRVASQEGLCSVELVIILPVVLYGTFVTHPEGRN